jgi:hypothetical protein
MTYPTILPRSARVLEEVSHERARQDARWGEQNHPDGTGPDLDIVDDIGYFPGDGNDALTECARLRTDALANVPGRVTFAHILTEEWAEAMECNTPDRLRTELIQVAAVAVSWVEAIDRRTS